MEARNPFFHRGPIREPAYFFGRRHEVDQALDLLRNGQSVSIVGPRRIGKTSLLLHLASSSVFAAHDLAPSRHCLVLVDCESWRQITPNDLYALLLEELRDALAAAGHQVDLPSPTAAISYRVFEQAVRAVVHQQVQLVFLLDEFETLSVNPHLDADAFSGLRALAMRHGVAYVTVSTRPLLDLTYAQANTLSSPFFNFFAQIRLGLFTRAEATDLLANLAAGSGRAFSESLIGRLLELAGPHPLLLQIAGYHAVDRWQLIGGPLEEAGAEHVQRAFLAEAESHWSYFWRVLPPHDQRLLALLPVATPSDPEGVQRLEHAGLVVRHSAGVVLPLSPALAAYVGRQPVPGLLQVPPITLDPGRRVALLRGRRLPLTPTEFELLACLLAHAGQVVPHGELQTQVWHDKVLLSSEDERLRTTIRTLRHALGSDEHCIENVRGAGYRFAASPQMAPG